MNKVYTILLIFFLIGEFAIAQPIQESMVIDAETKRPVPYASIGIMGTAKGTSSNVNGQFSLQIPVGASIRISCLGYKTQDIAEPLPQVIYLYPVVTQLQEIIVTNKKINAALVVMRAFRSLKENTLQQSFNQTFFYRHYCKDNGVYGRLIEASVEVYKPNGYKTVRTKPGENEGIRVNQLRRSFDKTIFAMGHVPIAVNSILESDLLAYRTRQPQGKIDFFNEVNATQADFGLYSFKFTGITLQDNEEVYVIEFESKKDSVQTTSGYTKLPFANGKYFITVKSNAFVKTETEKILGTDTVLTKTYYKKYDGFYFPYHISRTGKSYLRDGSTHFYNIEFVSTDLQTQKPLPFEGSEPNRFQLLNIPYDSSFWNSMSLLKTTPLEDKIIYDLGGGKSLAEQFYIYQQEQVKLLNSGKNGDEGFAWLVGYDFKKPKYVAFWRSACQPCIEELNTLFRNNKEDVYLISVSVDRDSANWTKALKQLKWQNNTRIKHIWLGNLSKVVEDLTVTELPKYFWYDKKGNIAIKQAAKPSTTAWRDQVNKLAKE
ncbi:MAG: carboxypeptidase-like regulatory domain-containing protein [Cyclobacteriaceae bacterium]|nr:carboxypeptidase-like regulatory domain-containing protein [Cyclobacteriaceae bacterium]